MEVFVAQCNIDRFTRLLAEATDPQEIRTLNLLLMNEQQFLEEATRRKWLIYQAGTVAPGAEADPTPAFAITAEAPPPNVRPAASIPRSTGHTAGRFRCP